MKDPAKVTWCRGCGNFTILRGVEEVLRDRLALSPKDYVVVSGIGQAAKSPHYLDMCNAFNGLHGRAMSNAVGIKLANPRLKVLLMSGDGDLLGEGGNHFLHGVRRNIGITCILHDNQVYGLTKGQASPTAWVDMKTKLQSEGVKASPLNPIHLALCLGAGFVARSSVSSPEHLKEMVTAALNYDGFSFVQVMQTCPSFNKTRPFKWYKENTALLPESYDKTNREKAILESLDLSLPFKLGIFFEKPGIAYEKAHTVLSGSTLFERGLTHTFSQADLDRLVG